jgi:hypothetical protein
MQNSLKKLTTQKRSHATISRSGMINVPSYSLRSVRRGLFYNLVTSLKLRNYIIMGILGFLFGGLAQAQEPSLIVLERAQVELIAHQINDASIFLQKYVGKKSSYGPNDIDSAIKTWRASTDKHPKTSDELIGLLGSFFGDYLIKKHNLEWKNYKDKQGIDLCIIHQGVYVYSFPYAVIYKAIIQKREDALEAVDTALATEIAAALKDKKVMTR